MTTPRIQEQGDIMFIRIDKLPDGLTETKAVEGKHITAHSETGHHHTIDANGCRMYEGADPNVCYLQMDSDSQVVHERSWDTHGSVTLDGGSCYIGIRQVERTPRGWERVAD